MPSRENNIGNVYAIVTSKGYALAQVAGIEEGIYYCRIFNQLYKEIPANAYDIIKQKEDYVLMLQLPSMAGKKWQMAIKIGKIDLPTDFKKPEYVRFSLGFNTDGYFNQWIIVSAYTTNDIDIEVWITKILKKNKYDESWKKDFLQLNPSFVANGPAIIEMLENGWTLEKWRPIDYDKNCHELWPTMYQGIK